MSDALLSPHSSPQYLAALKRALEMPQSKVIPFFGTFLKDLYSIFNEIPSLVVVSPKEKSKLEVSGQNETEMKKKINLIAANRYLVYK